MKPSDVSIKQFDCVSGGPESETMRRLAWARTKMGDKAAIAPDSTFKMPACVGSKILSTWTAQRVLERHKKGK